MNKGAQQSADLVTLAVAVARANGVRLTAAEGAAAARRRANSLSSELEAEGLALDEAARACAERPGPATERSFQSIQARVRAKTDDLEGFTTKILALTEARLAEAEAAHSEAQRVLAYAVVGEAVAQMAERIKVEVPQHCEALAALAGDVAGLSARVASVNADLPKGVRALRDAEELVRDRPQRQRVELSRERVELWVRVGSQEHVPLERQSRVHKKGDGRGLINVHGQLFDACLRQFWKITYLPDVPAATGPRLADLSLPPLRADETPFLSSERHPSLVSHFTGCGGALPGPRVEYIPIAGGDLGVGEE